MLVANQAGHVSRLVAATAEGRRYQRVNVSLFGRFMLPDLTEHECQVINMSPGGAALLTKALADEGDRVIAYLDNVGRIEGRVTRLFDGGFAIDINATDRKRDKLAAQLTWLANRDTLGLPEDRKDDRIEPVNPFSKIKLADGREYPCKISDISVSGAAVSCEVVPAVGAPVTLGRTAGRVVRHLPNGFAIEFSRRIADQASPGMEDNL
ncbi:MAG: PilZ domain-containing protein [Flavobacteriaceae bacterium]